MLFRSEAQDVVGGVAGPHELAPEPAEQRGVGVAGTLPVPRLVDDAAAHHAGPDPVGHDLGEAFVLRRREEGREAVAGIAGILGQPVGRDSCSIVASIRRQACSRARRTPSGESSSTWASTTTSSDFVTLSKTSRRS